MEIRPTNQRKFAIIVQIVTGNAYTQYTRQEIYIKHIKLTYLLNFLARITNKLFKYGATGSGMLHMRITGSLHMMSEGGAASNFDLTN